MEGRYVGGGGVGGVVGLFDGVLGFWASGYW